MTDKSIKKIIEQNIKDRKAMNSAEKLQYMMDFGDIAIQYDFCVN